MGKQQIDSLLVATLIAAMPVMMMTDIGHASGAFIALCVMGLWLYFSRTGGMQQSLADLKAYRWLAVALFVPLLAIIVSMVWHRKFLDSDTERVIRTSVGTLMILIACLSLTPQSLRQASWGLTIATLAAAGYVVWLGWPTLAQPGQVVEYNVIKIGQWLFTRPENLPEYNTVSYGNMLLMMTVLSTLSIGWSLTQFRKTEITLKLLVSLVGLIGFMGTQTRSSWLAMPFFVLIGLLLLAREFSVRKLLLPLVLACAVIATVFMASPITRERSAGAAQELSQCISNPVTISSVCIRLQLWHASWLMFKDNPLIGNGSTQGFVPAIQALANKKVVSDFIVSEGFDEPHNDLMFMLASYGLIGVLGLLLLYFAPAWIFAKRLATSVPQPARVAAAMGLAVCLGFFAFGMTELMFRGMRTMGFYAMMLGWLLALSDVGYLKRSKVLAD